MKKTASLFSLLFLSTTLLADPFYADEAPSSVPSEKSQPGGNQPPPTCSIPQGTQTIALASPFKQLKLIGLVQLNGTFRALFSDEQQGLIEVLNNDYLENGNVQITQIDLKSVRYIDWLNSRDCDHPLIVTLKL